MEKVKRDERKATRLEFEDPGGFNFDALQVAGAFDLPGLRPIQGG
jgi:hypothetical protein